MRREGNRIIIEPLAPLSLVALLRTLEPIEDEFEAIDELPESGIEL